MLFPDATFDLSPDLPRLPEQKLLAACSEVGFEPQQCLAKLDHLIRTLDINPAWFDFTSVAAGGIMASNKLLFEAFQNQSNWDWQWQMVSSVRQSFSVAISHNDVEIVAELIRKGSQSRDLGQFRKECKATMGATLSRRIWPPSLTKVPRVKNGFWPRIKEPGIYRREHASLVLRSRTTTLITDPQCYCRGWAAGGGRMPQDRQSPPVDAVLITHRHDDHWHLPSILRMTGDGDVPVIVPHVPKTNLLSPEDMAGSLQAAGQNVLTPPWWSSIEIGDFKIDILPFYGEQPLHDRPWGRDPGELRNWGNCYRFTCPEFSAIILVDSGMDPLGNMIDVLERSYTEQGRVDFLLSCCFCFPEGYNRGLPHYFLTVPLDHLRYLYRHPDKHGSMTHGPEGVVRACRAARCRYFLPYAHGFRGLARSPQGMEGAQQTEDQVLKTIANGLGRSKTKVLSWLPGDVARADQHETTIVSRTQQA